MGWLSDNLDFELFNLKDMFSKLKDNPEQLILGVDPFSTGLWNTLGVTDNEPIVNQLGGPYGGSSKMGLGSGGGVYADARAAGIDTGPATQMHDLAEVIAGSYGAAGAAGGLGNIGGAGAGGGGAAGGGAGGGSATTFALPETGSLGGGEFINAAGEPIAGGGGGMFDFGGMDWGDPSTYMDMMNMMPQGGGQQQQQQPAGPRPMPQIGGSPGVQMSQALPLAQRPPRSLPFGLLDEDEEEKRRKELALLGGLL